MDCFDLVAAVVVYYRSYEVAAVVDCAHIKVLVYLKNELIAELWRAYNAVRFYYYYTYQLSKYLTYRIFLAEVIVVVAFVD